MDKSRTARMAAALTFVTIVITNSCILVVHGNHDAKRLYDDLLRKRNYNKLIRPVNNSSDKLTVQMGLKLSQLIDVDERNEIIALNMWVIQIWDDSSLKWDPTQYGGVRTLYVPSESIWLPDIVLYNNADGDYNVTLMTKATLHHTGKVIWEPPAIYKSQCDINVAFFPFDEQICKLKFGSWTYDGFQVDLQHVWQSRYGDEETVLIEQGIDLNEYYSSTEWALLKVPAQKHIKYYPCCKEPFPDITFKIRIRRKTLHYAINLLVPSVCINLLTILVFYLPSDCGEKISLCISILLSLSIFQLLLMELMPATSLTIPLMGKYLMFTCIVVSISVFLSVVTLNVNFRSSGTCEMSQLTKRVFMDILPRILLMKKQQGEYEEEGREEEGHGMPMSEFSPCFRSAGTGSTGGLDSQRDYQSNPYRAQHYNPLTNDTCTVENTNIATTFVGNFDMSTFCDACSQNRLRKFAPNVQKGLESMLFISKHLSEDDSSSKVKDDWRYVALVIDRLLLWVYLTVCIVGSVGMLLNAPSLYDTTQPLDGVA